MLGTRHLLPLIAASATLGPGAEAADARVQALYESRCSACHVAGVANAPKLDDAEAWAPRLDKGMDALLASAKNGLGAMPPMGTCGECSDEDLVALIELMTEAVR